ncbi:tripartite ATP-independent transporter solute receptor, DctP family [Cohaesibacter sp. ES.047]|uniref:sialic acid TRAP transporter substrate-binding protein SiaP n=1 Tax=Cohaesibacter sp. ES.047 TaxID=1798205 RepID=UPI000BB82A9C|nr:sialic acid TRAP transporter substrate-binding protein SiaP [Cohaesibacter sp. ES.047]SNY90254.1 tripartite ATP-independent transporter solute receptor, DctP family [Cohaesibacter sp. ES.047]
MLKIVSAIVCAVLLPVTAAQAETLSLGMQESPGHNLYKGAVAANEKLKELSGGTMDINIFPSSQLGEFRAMAGQVQFGELDIFVHGYTDLNYMMPNLTLLGAPYVLPSFEAFEKLIASSYGDGIEADYVANDLHPIDNWYLGMRQMTSNRPINSIEDMKGLKLRVPNVDQLIAFAEAVGAQPSPVAFQEVYLALQTNQVDAEENPLPTIENMKFYEVQDYIAMTSHFMAAMTVTMSEATWQKLSDQQRDWVTEALKYGGSVSDELTFEGERNLLSFFKEKGLTVTYPELEPFREAMQPFYAKMNEKFGEGSIEKLLEFAN